MTPPKWKWAVGCMRKSDFGSVYSTVRLIGVPSNLSRNSDDRRGGCGQFPLVSRAGLRD
jgi:hypothetical protein